jgi:hypothetical protein
MVDENFVKEAYKVSIKGPSQHFLIRLAHTPKNFNYCVWEELK